MSKKSDRLELDTPKTAWPVLQNSQVHIKQRETVTG